jgi:hypothetical protein
MASRLRITGVVLIIVGVVAWVAAGYAYIQTQNGSNALQGFSEAQNVTLNYNGDGELIDRGTTEGAAAIYALLGETWGWPIADGDLDPNDPLVDTATEYMYQMATIAYHTLHGTQNVVLTEVVNWDGSSVVEEEPEGATEYFGGEWDPATVAEAAVFNPGTYQVPVAERYWTQFNRMHPLDGPTRSQAWNGTVHGLFAELGVGATTATSLQLALGIVAITLLMGLGFVIAGGGLLWVSMGGRKEGEPATA